jgi:hypothetical protein
MNPQNQQTSIELAYAVVRFTPYTFGLYYHKPGEPQNGTLFARITTPPELDTAVGEGNPDLLPEVEAWVSREVFRCIQAHTSIPLCSVDFLGVSVGYDRTMQDLYDLWDYPCIRVIDQPGAFTIKIPRPFRQATENAEFIIAKPLGSISKDYRAYISGNPRCRIAVSNQNGIWLMDYSLPSGGTGESIYIGPAKDADEAYKMAKMILVQILTETLNLLNR